jgi:hypothetical protein
MSTIFAFFFALGGFMMRLPHSSEVASVRQSSGGLNLE